MPIDNLDTVKSNYLAWAGDDLGAAISISNLLSFYLANNGASGGSSGLTQAQAQAAFEAALAAYSAAKSTNAIATYTTTNPVISTASASVIAANTNRKHLIITNPTSGTTIFLRLAAAAATTSGQPLYPGDRYEIDNSNLYTGEIRAIAASGTSTLIVTEGV